MHLPPKRIFSPNQRQGAIDENFNECESSAKEFFDYASLLEGFSCSTSMVFLSSMCILTMPSSGALVRVWVFRHLIMKPLDHIPLLNIEIGLLQFCAGSPAPGQEIESAPAIAATTWQHSFYWLTAKLSQKCYCDDLTIIQTFLVCVLFLGKIEVKNK